MVWKLITCMILCAIEGESLWDTDQITVLNMLKEQTWEMDDEKYLEAVNTRGCLSPSRCWLKTRKRIMKYILLFFFLSFGCEEARKKILVIFWNNRSLWGYVQYKV